MATPTTDDLLIAYAHVAGQVAVATNLAAALAALHPEHRQVLERVLAITGASDGYKHPGGSAVAEEAYAQGVKHAISVFRAAMDGMS